MTTRSAHDNVITIGRRGFICKGVAGVVGLLFSEALFGSSVFAESLIKETSISLHDPACIRNAIKLLWEDRRRCGVTPLLRLVPPFNQQRLRRLQSLSGSFQSITLEPKDVRPMYPNEILHARETKAA